MLLKHLINPKPSIILFFIGFCILFACLPLLNSDLNNIFSHPWASPYLVLILGILIPTFHALGLNNLIYEKNIIRKDNLVLGFIYLLICTPFLNTINEWFISFFLLFYINYLFESHQKEYPFSQLFNASFILAILTFFTPNLFILGLLMIISSINYRNLNWRTITTIFIGYCTPLMFYLIYLKLNGSSLQLPNYSNFQLISFPDYKNFKLAELIWISTLVIISIFSFIELFKWLYKKSIQSRKSFLIILFYFLLCLFMISLGSSWYLLATPLAVIIGNYFIYSKSRKIATLLFLMLVISSCYYKYMIVL